MSIRQGFEEIMSVEPAVRLTILVAALGYFVDIFDLLMFSVVRVESLKALGVEESRLLSVGITLINAQMAGLLLGGLVWGVIGDRYGRLKVLFGSILLYSLANIANGFTHSVEVYAALRFLAGIGLAGELGAGVTLASELLPKSARGLGTAFIASVGVLGATAAVAVAGLADWRMAYIVGGCMGLALLILRFQVRESGMYREMAEEEGSRGNILLFFTRPELLRRLAAVILIGAPIWGVVGLFITFTPEFAKDLGMSVLPTAGTAVLFCYIGLSLGDFISGLLSQHLRSRRKAVCISLISLLAMIGLYVGLPHDSLTVYYFICFLMGAATGYWAMFVQMGAEQFGTNIRATAATSIPNFVRGLTIPMTAGFHALIPALGVTGAGLAVMGTVIALAFAALLALGETFGKDLNYVEG